ncbi:hypothetical protein Q5H92_26245 [Hymenobacter sp. M29]|uniref:Outer membrane protein beta-barrel domain-containing protein n=1 Tax=Hymenobacter mellowenesis TaxID=3063995 RepID=A0ABT9AJT5_9BACT|nr:hypothetical protein [Hymenobacter sp. M29]MDO7849888.1 hypothetical protein [Hymenobacter sp. M29]
MSTFYQTLFVAAGLAVLPLAAAQAQSQPVRKAVAKPAAKPAPKPAAKPGTRPAPKPAPKPAPPARAAAPAPAPAPATAPPPPPPPASATVDTQPFDVGDNVVNVGIGFGNRYGYGTAFFGGSSSVSPALSVSYERGLLPLGPGVLGAGLFVGYQGATYNFGSGDKWKFTDIVVMLRGAFHYPVLPKLDTYGGVGLGLRHAGVSFEGNSFYNVGAASSNDVALGLFVGGRYYFTPGIGAFAELGYDQTYLKIGLAGKF